VKPWLNASLPVNPLQTQSMILTCLNLPEVIHGVTHSLDLNS